MKSRSKEDKLRTNSLINAYQVSDSEETKMVILTELYGLWEKAISNLSWFVLGKNKHNLECIERSTGLTFSDIKQEAFFGFKQAVETYDSNKARFFTYLAGGIRHHLHCYLSQMRRGNHNLQFFSKFRYAAFEQEKGEKGFELDDLWQIHLDINSYRNLLRFRIKNKGKSYDYAFSKKAFSQKLLCALNAVMFQETISLDDMVSRGIEPKDKLVWKPGQALEEKDLTVKLEKLLLTIYKFGDNGRDNKVRLILTARYGLDLFSDEIIDLGLEPGRAYKRAAIGRRMGLTRERIRQLNNKGLNGLRNDARINALRNVIDDYWFDNITVKS